MHDIPVFLRDVDVYYIQSEVFKRPGRFNWAIVKKIDSVLGWKYSSYNEKTDFSKREVGIWLNINQLLHIQHILARKGGQYNWSVINQINSQSPHKYYFENGFFHDYYNDIFYCMNCEQQRTFSNNMCDHCGVEYVMSN